MEVGGINFSVYNLVLTGIFIIVTTVILFIIKRIIYKVDKFDEGKKYAIYRLIKYVAVVICIVIVLRIFGIDITIFVAGSAALLVGLGLGIQSLFLDFISGIEILLEGTIEVNDIIQIDNMTARVMEISLRTSYVLTNDGIYIIVPNSQLTSSKLINWTHEKDESRFHIQVGISYNADIDTAMKLMVDSALNHVHIDKAPAPFVRLHDFADSAVMLDLLFWSKEVFIIDDIKSDIRMDIYRKFRDNNIEIPYPQRTIHINSEDKKIK